MPLAARHPSPEGSKKCQRRTSKSQAAFTGSISPWAVSHLSLLRVHTDSRVPDFGHGGSQNASPSMDRPFHRSTAPGLGADQRGILPAAMYFWSANYTLYNHALSRTCDFPAPE